MADACPNPFGDDPILSPQPSAIHINATALTGSNYCWVGPLRTLEAAEPFAVKTAPTRPVRTLIRSQERSAAGLH